MEIFFNEHCSKTVLAVFFLVLLVKSSRRSIFWIEVTNYSIKGDEFDIVKLTVHGNGKGYVPSSQDGGSTVTTSHSTKKAAQEFSEMIIEEEEEASSDKLQIPKGKKIEFKLDHEQKHGSESNAGKVKPEKVKSKKRKKSTFSQQLRSIFHLRISVASEVSYSDSNHP